MNAFLGVVKIDICLKAVECQLWEKPSLCCILNCIIYFLFYIMFLCRF